MSDLFENIDQNKAFFISRDAKGKIRCIETYFDKVNDGYCIHRFSYQYGGKHTEQPSITITQGKVKRDTYAQTLLRFNAICKVYPLIIYSINTKVVEFILKLCITLIFIY